MVRCITSLAVLLLIVSSHALATPTTTTGLEDNPKLLKITFIPYLGAHAFPEGSGIGSSPEIGSLFTTPLSDTTHLLFGIGFSRGFKDDSLHSITSTEWGLQFDTPFKLLSPYAKSYTTVLFTRDTHSRTTQLALGFGLRFFMKKEGNMVLRTDARFISGAAYRAGFERLAITKRPAWLKPLKPKAASSTPEKVTTSTPDQPIYYRVIADSVKDQETANQLSDELVRKGYETYLWRDKVRNIYHVQVYFVKEVDLANTYKEQLIKAGYTKTYLMQKG